MKFQKNSTFFLKAFLFILFLIFFVFSIHPVKAQSECPSVGSCDSTIEGIINNIIDNAVQPFIYFLIVVATVVFIWGVIEFIAGAENETKRTKGKLHILWGIVGLTIMISVLGIMRVILNFVNSVK